MPAKPGTSARKVIDPTAAHQNPDRTTDPANPVVSSTWDPNFGIEAGRNVSGIVTAVTLSATVSTKADGAQTAIATTGGSGSGCKVSYSVASNVASGATVAAGGSGYKSGETLTVVGDTGVKLTTTV